MQYAAPAAVYAIENHIRFAVLKVGLTSVQGSGKVEAGFGILVESCGQGIFLEKLVAFHIYVRPGNALTEYCVVVM
jgi:hypothetical protein